MKKEILCTICARKNSKGLKDKNFLQLKKKPLISHSILQAKTHILKVNKKFHKNKYITLFFGKLAAFILFPRV